MRVGQFLGLFREAFREWNEDRAPRLGAALAYYTIFSIAPLLVIVIAICAQVFGDDAARRHIRDEIETMVGRPAAEAVEDMLRHAHGKGSGPWATGLGVVTLLFGALGVFVQLQDALNTVWKVEPKPGRGWLHMLRDRALSFAMVLGTGFLLLVSLVASTVLQAVRTFGDHLFEPAHLPGGLSIWQTANAVLSFAFITVLFAMIYKILPDVRIRWRDVWAGALIATVLFTIGKYLIGLYLGRAGVTSAFGAAGSLVIVLVWVYYSSQILLYGAEFTRVYARHIGDHVGPASYAVMVSAPEPPRQRLANRADVGSADRE